MSLRRKNDRRNPRRQRPTTRPFRRVMKISSSEGPGSPNLSRVAHKVKHRVSHPVRACKTLTGFAQARPDAKPLHNLSTTPLAASVGLRPPVIILSVSAAVELPPAVLSF